MYYIDTSDCTDPWFNLALEEYAVRNLDKKKDYLLLYVNQPCLIIGKHQNLLEEINLATAGELNIPVIRRISGGGTVFHDTGNLNISIITNQTIRNFNKYLDFLKPILEILKELSLPVYLNNRNNLILDDKKISGNAQFTSKQRLLSHGTLLINSDLDTMNRLIKSENKSNYHSNSTKSVRSNVTNINYFLDSQVNIDHMRKLILKKIYGNRIKYYQPDAQQLDAIKKLSETKYKSWQWNYELSPKCEIFKKLSTGKKCAELKLVIDKGIVHFISLEGNDISKFVKNTLYNYLIDQPYDYASVKNISKSIKKNNLLKPWNQLPWVKILLN